MVADFTQSGRACSSVFRLWGSCTGLVVLGICYSGVQHPPWAGEAIWFTENPNGSSPGHPDSERPSEIFSRFRQACCSFSGLQGVLPGAGSPMQLVH